MIPDRIRLRPMPAVISDIKLIPLDKAPKNTGMPTNILTIEYIVKL